MSLSLREGKHHFHSILALLTNLHGKFVFIFVSNVHCVDFHFFFSPSVNLRLWFLAHRKTEYVIVYHCAHRRKSLVWRKKRSQSMGCLSSTGFVSHMSGQGEPLYFKKKSLCRLCCLNSSALWIKLIPLPLLSHSLGCLWILRSRDAVLTARHCNMSASHGRRGFPAYLSFSSYPPLVMRPSSDIWYFPICHMLWILQCSPFTGPRRHGRKMAPVEWKEAHGGNGLWRRRRMGTQILSQKTSRRRSWEILIKALIHPWNVRCRAAIIVD